MSFQTWIKPFVFFFLLACILVAVLSLGSSLNNVEATTGAIGSGVVESAEVATFVEHTTLKDGTKCIETNFGESKVRIECEQKNGQPLNFFFNSK